MWNELISSSAAKTTTTTTTTKKHDADLLLPDVNQMERQTGRYSGTTFYVTFNRGQYHIAIDLFEN